MEDSLNETKNLAAAAEVVAAESDVRGSDFSQEGDLKEEHDGLVKVFESETEKGDVKEASLVEGSDKNNGDLSVDAKIDVESEMVSVKKTEEVQTDGFEGGKEAIVEVGVVTETVIETEVVSVEEKREARYTDGVEGGKEVEVEVSVVTKTVTETEVVSVEEKEEEARDMDGLEDFKEEEKGDDLGNAVDTEMVSIEEETEVQVINGIEDSKAEEKGADLGNAVDTEMVSVEEKTEVQDMDGLEGVKEAENEIENLEKGGVQENGVQNVEKRDGSDEEDEDDDVGEKEHEFAVGDFVWGKIKSYPWWPGQIYDPSHASAYAEKKRIVKGSFLVAYFGDASFSWCRKSQLKRFTENFDEMSRQSNSKNFLYAVSEALDVFSKVVEMEMTCKCIPLENHIQDFKLRNRGIKVGVSVPRGDYLKIFLARLKPEQLIDNLNHAAKTGSVTSPLELHVLRSFLASFYRKKGGYTLVKFHEPIPIEGLEDKMGNGLNGKTEFSEVVFAPIQGPGDEDWTPTQASEDKVYKRKKKTVAEIMEEDMVGIELMQESIDKLGSNKKIRKRDNGSENGSAKINSGRKRGRKRKEKTVSKSPESVENGDGERSGSDGEEETLKSLSSRERKKSKYLSPPYTIPPKGNTPKIGERLTKIAGQLIGSTPKSEKKQSQQVDTSLDANEVLSVITNVAVDPLHSTGNENLEKVTGFVSAFRGAMYSNGSQEVSDKTSLKRKSKAGEASLLITFPQSFALPSKEDLLEMFGKYGELNETITDVYSNSFSARVAFVRNTDAEEAHSECVKNNPFENANVNCRLLYTGGKRGLAGRKKKAADSESTGLELVKQKLEELASEVKTWEDGKVTAKMKNKLEGELEELAEEVINLR